jgi:glycosyltransferase involved in cell wall biosynthesis
MDAIEPGMSKGGCLFVLPWTPDKVGGVNEAVFGKAKALLADGRYQPYIGVASWSPQSLPGEMRGIPVIDIRIHDGYGQGSMATAKSFLRLPTDLAGLARLLKRYDIRMVNCEFPVLGGAVFLLLKRLGLFSGKVTMTLQGADVGRLEQSQGWTRSAWRSYLGGADAVFACSQSLERRVRAVAPHARLSTIYNAADVNAFRLERAPRTGAPKRLLNIAKYEHKKGQDILLAAFRKLLDQGHDAHLTMIGADGPAFDEIQKLVAPFEQNVRMLVDIPHADIVGYMAEADIFVLPSRAEGFPLVLVEAAASGLPLVASNVDGIPELITHGESGLMVNPDDVDALARALESVIKNDALARALAAAGQKKADEFTWERSAQKMLAQLGATSA